MWFLKWKLHRWAQQGTKTITMMQCDMLHVWISMVKSNKACTSVVDPVREVCAFEGITLRTKPCRLELDTTAQAGPQLCLEPMITRHPLLSWHHSLGISRKYHEHLESLPGCMCCIVAYSSCNIAAQFAIREPAQQCSPNWCLWCYMVNGRSTDIRG